MAKRPGRGQPGWALRLSARPMLLCIYSRQCRLLLSQRRSHDEETFAGPPPVMVQNERLYMSFYL